MLGGLQNQKVEAVTSRTTLEGTLITAHLITLRGNDAGTEQVLVRPDGSDHPVNPPR